MEFTAAVPNRRVDYSLAFQDFGMSSRGQLRLTPEGEGTRVTWTNEGDMGGNPVNRYFGLLMDRMVGPDFEAGLANLKAAAERG
jgi:carbon monoxide dehydrogenase subunit G